MNSRLQAASEPIILIIRKNTEYQISVDSNYDLQYVQYSIQFIHVDLISLWYLNKSLTFIDIKHTSVQIELGIINFNFTF